VTWLWKYDSSKGYNVVTAIRNMDAVDEFKVVLSPPLGPRFPVVDMDVTCEGVLPEFFRAGPLRIVSGRIRAVVQQAGGRAEFFPVAIRTAGEPPSVGKFFFMHPLDELSCMDEKRSEFTMDNGYIDNVTRFVIDESIARQKPMFRLARSFLMPLFVSDALADALRSLNAAGVALLPAESFRHT
jgi:hypothetical protein